MNSEETNPYESPSVDVPSSSFYKEETIIDYAGRSDIDDIMRDTERMFRERDINCICDTLLVFLPGAIAASVEHVVCKNKEVTCVILATAAAIGVLFAHRNYQHFMSYFNSEIEKMRKESKYKPLDQ